MSFDALYSAPSRPPHMTKVFAPSSAARSMLRSTLRSAKRRTLRSFEVKPPSLKTGGLKRLVVTIGMIRPVDSSAPFRRSISVCRSASVEPKAKRSSSWKVRPYAPSSASFSTTCTTSRGARVGPPKGSVPL